MSVEFGAMLALLVAGALMRLPIGIALISASIAYLWMRGLPLVAVTNTIMQGFSSNFVFLAIPLFIFAAQVMNIGTITDRLLGFAVAVAGRTKGGLAQVNVITSLIFSGMSGSATADAAGVGTVLVKMMRKNDRYPAGFAGAVTAASSVIGPIFPPSIPMIYYAISADTSVGALFLGGIIPALFITVAMMVLNSVIARRRNFPIEPAQSSGEIFTQLRIAMLPLLTPFILLGGIYSGVMTPTEAAAVAAAYAIIVSIYYRALGFKAFFRALEESARKSAVVVMIIAGAFMFSYVIAIERLPNTLVAWVSDWEISATAFLLLINLMILLLGMIMPAATILLVIIPVLVPATMAMGIDPVHFGVVIVINTMIGLITPPYGVLVFVTSAVNDIDAWSIIREIVPYIGVLLFCLLTLSLFPEIVLYLPKTFGYRPL
ncbi:MAG: TRAP transporter large permease [Rhizobiaceae bacterium]|nr:TRAP transporter large permease [Rhizobiaceae bacterium]